jgi:cytochrome c oxidase subunit 2
LGNKVGDEIQPIAITELLPKKSVAKVEIKSEEPVKVSAKVTEKAEIHADLSLADLSVQGKAVYEKNCSSCHGADGAGMPGVFPAITASKVVTGDINKQVEL